jgi:oligosaccharide repeat unit polymerase
MNIVETKSEYNDIQTNIQDFDFNKLSKTIYYFLLAAVIAYIAVGGHKSLASVYSGDGVLEEQGIASYIYVLIVSNAILLSVFMFRNENSTKWKIVYFISICCLIIFFLTLGSRTFPLMLALCSIVAFNNHIRKISVPVLLLLLVIGATVLTFVVFARTNSITSQSYISDALYNADIEMVWDLGYDLIINNRNLYSLVDYADKYGYTYGMTMAGGFLSPIPFAQSFICSAFEIPPEFLSSNGFSTYIDLGAGSSWGLGTNLVADAYLSFGMIGVVFFFGMLGFLVSKSKAMANYNVYWTICYYILVSNAIFFARGGFFDCFRFLIWGIVIIYIITFIERRVEF